MTDFTELVDLAAERLGGVAVIANDEFFAPRESLLAAAPPVWIADRYTERGKWMDGWETRRRRSPGYDWCIIRLGLPGIVRGVLVDTSYFRGNYPAHCSIEGCALPGIPSPEQLVDEGVAWTGIVPHSPLRGDAQNLFPIEAPQRFTHLRLNIFPDGGVARLRVYGEALPDWERLARRGGQLDLAAVEQGGRVLAASDMFFGHRHNLIMPGRSTHMGDGWETKRRRGAGHDWTLIHLGAPGILQRVEVDTDHFKGNAPASCALEGCDAEGATVEELMGEEVAWRDVLPRTRLQPHARHVFEEEVGPGGRVTHARFHIYPDGGIARLRLFGVLAGRTPLPRPLPHEGRGENDTAG